MKGRAPDRWPATQSHQQPGYILPDLPPARCHIHMGLTAFLMSNEIKVQSNLVSDNPVLQGWIPKFWWAIRGNDSQCQTRDRSREIIFKKSENVRISSQKEVSGEENQSEGEVQILNHLNYWGPLQILLYFHYAPNQAQDRMRGNSLMLHQERFRLEIRENVFT